MTTPPDERPRSRLAWWLCGAALAAGCAATLYFSQGRPGGGTSTPEDPHAQVARRAAERMAGARCVGARASREQKAAIARLLAVDVVSPRGRLPAWLPTEFVAAGDGPNGSDAWNTLAGGCADAPTFGTPFGFPSAEIEKALREDAEFASLSDRQWEQIRAFEAGAGAVKRP